MEKLSKLRTLMAQHKIDTYLIPRADEYLGEFVAPHAERLYWLTGFTGSAGTAIITQNTATVMSDGRYRIQLGQQLDPAHFTPANSVKNTLKDWLFEHTRPAQTIGFDPSLHSIDQIETLHKHLTEKTITLKPIPENLIDQIWPDQPPRPNNPVIPFPEALAGQSAQEKIAQICGNLAKQGADAAILTQPDSINWLLNIRGTDIAYTPIKQTYAYVDIETQDVILFKDSDFQNNVLKIVPSDCEAAKGRLKAYEVSGKKLAMDFLHTPYALKAKNTINIKDPCIPLKARKNAAEQAAIREAHIQDGIAMVKFLRWFEENAIGQTEISVAEKLEEYRAENPAYKGPSFPTIAGFNANGAIVHYRATEQTNQTITKDGLLLLDSGAQYYTDDLAGTTDITRTIATGAVSDDIKKHNTLVLKGHIALAMAEFPAGTTGKELDQIARQPLLDHGLDYAHGTGHGVGCYLAVHEAAANISTRGAEAPQPGMLLSNEPGYYEPSSHGIRIENLILIQPAEQGTLKSETITLAPLDKSLILADILSPEEKAWLNDYHNNVFNMLSPLLDNQNQQWLQRACQHIE